MLRFRRFPDIRSAFARTRQVAALAVAIVVAACGPDDDASAPEAPADDAPRIVSLSPALTDALVELGARDTLVGRTPWCRGVDDAPVVGSLLEVDLEAILATRPTLVLVQPAASGLDPGLARLVEEGAIRVRAFRIERLADVDDVLLGLGTELADAGLDRTRLEAALAAWRARRDAALAPLAPLPIDGARGEDDGAARARVAIRLGADPGLLVGGESFLDDVLEALGVRNAVTRAGYLGVSDEELARLRCDHFVQVVADETAVEPMRASLAALFADRDRAPSHHVLADGDAWVPGPRIVETARRLRAVLNDALASDDLQRDSS